MSQIQHLVTLQSPNGGLSKSKARIIYRNTQVYICNGTRFVYVFSTEKRQMTAVYLFPSNVWHIEFPTSSRQLYVLCAQNGLYLLEWDEQGRLLMEPSSAINKGDVTVYQMGPTFGRVLDPSICSFMVAHEVLVVVLALQDKWKISAFQLESLKHEEPSTAPSREVTFSHKYGLDRCDLQPVLCCVSLWKEEAMSADSPRHSALQAALFTRLFGVDLAILESPMILCGFPDGQVVSFPLESAGVRHSTNQNIAQGSMKLLYHLEQPVVSIATIRMRSCDLNTEQPPAENTACDCLLVVGQKGLIVSVTSGDNPDAVSCAYKDYRLPSSVICTFYSTSGVFCCTSSDLIHVTVSHRGKETASNNTACSTVSSLRHNIPMIVALSQVSSLDATQLVALSKRGRLVLCKLHQNESKDHRHGLSCVIAGQRIKEMLSGIGSVSERFSALKTVVDEKSRSLTRLNQVMSLSRELLSGQGTICPVRCAIRVSWTHILQEACMTVYCNLENQSDYILEHGWTLCLLISTDPITSYSFPVLLLKPGETKEFAFPLPGLGSNSLDFPVKISGSLFYSVNGFSADGGNSSEPSVSSSHNHGVCLPLQEHIIDILQCLRIIPRAAYCSASSRTLPEDAVRAIWKSSPESDQCGKSSATVCNQRLHSTMPFKASVRLSAVLLDCSLQNKKSGRSLCSAVLHWLLSEVLVNKEDVQEVQGLTPDGKELCIRVEEVSVDELSSHGSIPAVEMQILSSHLHVVASLHLAVISRYKILLQQNNPNTDSRSPDLSLGKIQQLFSAHELLLKEVKNLRERLGVDEDLISRAAAQRLLHIYRDLRDPGLLFI
ncbi:Fanconi anemia core complex-associated protein 100 [Rhinoderma darwinii]|uniref:Fanconi anemia core complex-associated protein 100 n=1 Tax=Rhinoderma darwinii TaxID=43563 RepID=UPI003F665937